MNKFFLAITLTAFLGSCNSKNETDKKEESKEEPKKEAENKVMVNDTTPKVIGVGGVFFYTKDPKQLKDWYTKNLGIEINDWGTASFDTRNVNNPDEVQTFQWAPFKVGDQYFSPSTKEFMVNYRVQNIEGLVRNLRSNGITILDSIATYDYGKFVHLMDDEGNKIELWEPIDNNAVSK